LWDKLVLIGVKRCAQSLMKMSLSWQDLDLADEELPNVSGEPEAKPASSLFAAIVMKELADNAVNSQLNKAVQSCDPAVVVPTPPNGVDNSKGGATASFPALVLGAFLRETLDDGAWWQSFGGKGTLARKRLGYGGMNRFLAEMHLLREIAPTDDDVANSISEADAKMVALYQQINPGKKDVRAPADWTQAYSKRCSGTTALSAQ
jgi:hypothetical protein